MADEKKKDPFALESGVPGIEGEMRPKPKLADRISWKVGAVAALFLMVALGFLMWGMSGIDKPAAAPAKPADANNGGLVGASPPKDMVSPTPAVVTIGVPGEAKLQEQQVAGSLLGRSMGGVLGGDAAAASSPVAAGGHAGKGGGIPGVDWSGHGVPATSSIPPKTGEAGVSGAALTPAQQAAEQRRAARQAAIDRENEARAARLSQAKSGGLSARTFDGGVGGASAPNPSDALKSDLMAMAKSSQAAQQQAAQAGGQGKAADGEQDEKLAFLDAAKKAPRNYHPYVPMAPLSQNEIKEGVAIPLVLDGGMNSTLPGQITAHSTDDVYDTVSGCRLLLPASTQFIGRYDSKVAIGQDRALFVWNSAIFRDGSELNLAGMQGYDMAGQSGLASDVDNHYLRLFGLAFGMSMVTSGVQLSVPQPTQGANGNTAMTSQQVVTTALAQQYGQLGAQILGKYMNVQPTLRNFPGERFTILVPHTIVFGKVWRNRCGGVARN